MDKEKLRTVIRRALMVLLLASAVLLARETGYFSRLGEKLTAAETQADSPAASAASAEMAGAISPQCILVCTEDGKRASAYDGEATERAYSRFSALLGEALGSAGEPEEIREAAFQSSLGGECVFMRFECGGPLGLLSGWLGTDMGGSAAEMTADLLCLCPDGDATALLFRSTDGRFFRCETAAQSETLYSRMSDFQALAACFAFEVETLGGIDGYTVVLQEMPEVRHVSAAQVKGSAAETLMDSFGINSHVASSYPETDGTTVYIDGESTLRISPTGELNFRAADGTDAPQAESLLAAVRCAYGLCERCTGETGGSAKLRFAGTETEDDVCTVWFDYTVNCIPLRLSEGHAAQFVFTAGRLTEAQILLHCCTVEEKTEAVMPMRMAAAVAAAAGGSAPALTYADSGDGIVCIWVND